MVTLQLVVLAVKYLAELASGYFQMQCFFLLILDYRTLHDFAASACTSNS